MNLEDNLKVVTVLVMVESGASHNFLSLKVAAALDLHVYG
jgi:hypothetical protein